MKSERCGTAAAENLKRNGIADTGMSLYILNFQLYIMDIKIIYLIISIHINERTNAGDALHADTGGDLIGDAEYEARFGFHDLQ